MAGQDRSQGLNPYAEEFGILPRDELSRILKKYRSDSTSSPNKLTLNDIKRECSLLHNGMFHHIVANTPVFQVKPIYRMGPHRLRRLSRFILLAERGYIVKRGGKILYLNEPEPVVQDKVYRICFTDRGRPTIIPGKSAPTPKQMPRLFTEFAKPEKA